MKLSISSKRFIFVFCFILLSILSYGIITSVNNNETTQVNATPIANKVIVIDAGHGLPDERSCRF